MAKKALLTGGSRGIGKAIVLALAKEGYDVAFSYSSKVDEAKKVAAQIEAMGQKAYIYQAQLEQPNAAHELFQKAVADLGGLDLLVNNAGITITAPVQDITEEGLDHLLNLDFRTFVILMRDATRYMIDHGIRGNVINVSSSRGQRAYPDCGVYCALKAGLVRAAESFALDVAEYGIRINNVAPGAIRIRTKDELAAQTKPEGKNDYYWMDEYLDNTDPVENDFWDKLGGAIPLGRCGTPEDIANAVVFLQSEKASYITGFTLRVDGGLILPGMPEGFNGDGQVTGWK